MVAKHKRIKVSGLITQVTKIDGKNTQKSQSVNPTNSFAGFQVHLALKCKVSLFILSRMGKSISQVTLVNIH